MSKNIKISENKHAYSEYKEQTINLFYGLKLKLLFAILLSIVSVVIMATAPYFLGKATDIICEAVVDVWDNEFDFTSFIFLISISFVIYLFVFLLNFGIRVLINHISVDLSFTIRNKMYEKINRLHLSYFDDSNSGDLISRFINDVDLVGSNICYVLTAVISGIFTIIVVQIAMFLINKILALITLIFIPLACLVIYLFIHVSQKYFNKQQEVLGELTAITDESIYGRDVIVVYNKQVYFRKKFAYFNDLITKCGLKAYLISKSNQPALSLIINIGYIVVVFVGGLLCLANLATVGTIQIFIQYINQYSTPLRQIGQNIIAFQQIFASLRRIIDVLLEKEESNTIYTNTDPNYEEVIDSRCKKSEFSCSQKNKKNSTPLFNLMSVSVDLESSRVLNDINMYIKKNQHIAIVGATGAGKTTLLRLFLKFFDDYKGDIYYDCKNIKKINNCDLYSKISYISQDCFLFKGSIWYNLTYGNSKLKKSYVIDTCKKTGAYEIIDKFPGKFDFLIDNNGKNLSQGEKQILCITREMLTKKEIFLIDEATSSIDSTYEKKITNALDVLCRNKTSITIAHRITTIINSDLIIVLDNGKIVEEGTHSQLLDNKGLYWSYYTENVS